MEHRFTDGDLAGHAVGNLVLAGLVDAGHDLVAAAASLSRWLGVDPEVMQVLPATDAPIDLVAETPEGTVRGQVAIEAAGRLVHIAVDPPDPPVPAAATWSTALAWSAAGCSIDWYAAAMPSDAE